MKTLFLFTFVLGALLTVSPLLVNEMSVAGTMGNVNGSNAYLLLDSMCLSRFTVPVRGTIEKLKVHCELPTELSEMSVAVYNADGGLYQFSYPVEGLIYETVLEVPLRVPLHVDAGEDLYFTVWGNRYMIFYDNLVGSENYVKDHYTWTGGAFPVEAPLSGLAPISWQFAISADIQEETTPSPSPSATPTPSTSPSPSPSTSPTPTPYSTSSPSPSPPPEVPEFPSTLQVVGVLLMGASVIGYYAKRKSKS